MLTVDLPLPPSANALFKNNRQGGRSKTTAYRGWLEQAEYAITMAWRSSSRAAIKAPLQLTVQLGIADRRRDAGNCLKPIEDALVKFVPDLPDDRYNDRILIERSDELSAGIARVTIAALADTS